MKHKVPKYKFQNIMLIDDNDLDNFINEKTIEANYFAKKVYICSSGLSAVEFLNNMMIMDEQFSFSFPEVIFVDLNMPLMDGFKFIEYFVKNQQKKLNKPKIVILTSSVFPEDVKKAKDISNEIIFLNKPLTKLMLDKL